jgi:hypothetical protein
LSVSNCSEMPLNCMQNWEISVIIREILIKAFKKLRVYIYCMGSAFRNYLAIFFFFKFLLIGFDEGCKPFYNNNYIFSIVPRITMNTVFFFLIL